MSDVDSIDFLQVISQPTRAYQEGLRFFQGVGLLNDTLRQLAQDLDNLEIPYCVIGAVALNQHGYQRFTHDIDILITREGLARFSEKLVGRGYRPAFQGAKRKFRATVENVPIEVIIAGDYPGDGKPKAIAFPNPADCTVVIDNIKTVTLTKLVELKIASGMTGAGRRKDLADVQELIKVRNLPADFADQLDASVQPMFRELFEEIAPAGDQSLAPDWEEFEEI